MRRVLVEISRLRVPPCVYSQSPRSSSLSSLSRPISRTIQFSQRLSYYTAANMSAQLEQLMNTPLDVLAKIPAAKPPPGVTPNFANPETQVPLFMGVNTTLLIIATLFLGVRIYMKAWIQRKWKLDDSKSDMMASNSYHLHDIALLVAAYLFSALLYSAGTMGNEFLPILIHAEV